jgi:hypothetical protein
MRSRYSDNAANDLFLYFYSINYKAVMMTQLRNGCVLTSATCRSMAFLFLMIISPGKPEAQTILPEPDHIVVVFLENHAYSQIIGSADAPFINSLATGPNSALFTRSFGIEHPSQPNYLDIYSGSNQGVTDNEIPPGYPFKTPNLGRQLMDSLWTFTTFSENLPFVGFDGATSGFYVRKHNPVTNWIGSDTNQLPEQVNQPFSAFPSNDFNQLPTVCFVMPDQSNNMHDGSDPARIRNADNWLSNNLGSCIEWTKTHNSLFILTFDEDNYGNNNQIVTIFTGLMVKAGTYADSINHYSVLRTIEDMYKLPYAGNAAEALPITNCWKGTNTVNEQYPGNEEVFIYPNPARDEIFIRCDHFRPGCFAKLEISAMTGQRLIEKNLSGAAVGTTRLNNIPPGIYIVNMTFEHSTYSQKLIVK